MKKVIINDCFGGFSLSSAAINKYAELKGIKLYPETIMAGFITVYWTLPKDQRPPEIKPNKWHDTPLEERQAYNDFCRKNQVSDRDLHREDPYLIKVVEELGDAANGKYASLKIVEIPDDVEYEISEYDGSESIHEKHRSWG